MFLLISSFLHFVHKTLLLVGRTGLRPNFQLGSFLSFSVFLLFLLIFATLSFLGHVKLSDCIVNCETYVVQCTAVDNYLAVSAILLEQMK